MSYIIRDAKSFARCNLGVMRRAAFGLMLAGSVLLGQTVKPEAVAQASLGVSWAQKAHYGEAIQAYKRAIAIDPNLPGIYLNLGLAWFKLGNFREAIAAFDKENVKAPSDRVTTLLGMSYFGLGQYREAAQRLKPLARAQPANAELSYLLAKCYLWSGQYDEAMNLFKGLLDRDPNSVAVHMLLGEALDASYRTADAIAEFEAAVKWLLFNQMCTSDSGICTGGKNDIAKQSVSFGRSCEITQSTPKPRLI